MTYEGKTPDKRHSLFENAQRGTFVFCCGVALVFSVETCTLVNISGLAGAALRLHIALLFCGMALGYAITHVRLVRAHAHSDASGHDARVGRMTALASGLLGTVFLALDELLAQQAPPAARVLCACSSFLAGLCVSLLLLAWYKRGSRLTGADMPKALGCAAAGAFVLTIVIICFEQNISIVVLAALPAVSALLYCLPEEKQIDVPLASHRRHAALLDKSTHALVFSYALVLAFAYARTFDALAFHATATALALGTIIAIALVASNDRHATSVGNMGRVYLPVCTLLLFLTLAANTQTLAFASVVAFLSIALMFTSNIMFIASLALRYLEDPCELIVAGRLPGRLGFATGLLLAMLYAYVPVDMPYTLIAPCVLLMLLTCLYASLPFNRGNPVSEGIVKDMDEGIVALTADGNDFAATLKRTCAQKAKACGLTSREEEVLFYLACGYNMATTAELLSISASTVKTHTYRIYQKLGVHSQQDIIMDLRPEESITKRT